MLVDNLNVTDVCVGVLVVTHGWIYPGSDNSTWILIYFLFVLLLNPQPHCFTPFFQFLHLHSILLPSILSILLTKDVSEFLVVVCWVWMDWPLLGMLAKQHQLYCLALRQWCSTELHVELRRCEISTTSCDMIVPGMCIQCILICFER